MPTQTQRRLGEPIRSATQDSQPNTCSPSCRAKFDCTAENLCVKLCELDRLVADSVVERVTEDFVETSGPINHLVQAATAVPRPHSQDTPVGGHASTEVSGA